ncbi:Ubiquitin-protein ligase E3C [Toxocara canis]|uniref:HECT-type E3 ubiquitin transferase n=1 Tax=Toxocara canis TaxID=6265 RepID=A0A0B2VI98_TOXCA|nr:Ubiquitin-protein ligase E3C [Toxocara canis]
MAHNIFLYDFNGSVQRNRLQDAILKDMGQKDEFMKRLEDERNERHLLAKKKAAATKIQAVYRSYRTRKRYHAFLREKFDESGHATTLEQLRIQIARLAFFYRSSVDINRTVSLCADAVNLVQTQRMHLDLPKRQQLLRCAVGILPNVSKEGNYVPALRFIEIYLIDEGRSLIPAHHYFISILALFANQYDLAQPLRIEEWLPPRADSILNFILLPIRGSPTRSVSNSADYSSLVIATLFITLCNCPYEKHVVCAVMPFLCRLVRSGHLTLSEVIHAICDPDIPVLPAVAIENAPIFTYNLAMIVSASSLESLSLEDRGSLLELFAELVEHVSRPIVVQRKRSLEGDSDTDDDEPMPTTPVNIGCDPPATLGFYVDSVAGVLTDYALRDWFVESALCSENGVGALSSIAYFLRQNAPQAFMSLFCSLLVHKQFVSRLWRHIISLEKRAAFGDKRTLISILEKGEDVSDSDEHTLTSTLSLFIALLSNILQTVDDDDLANGGHGSVNVPFTLSQLASIATHFRDLTLGLIDVAYPVNVSAFPSTVAQSPVKSSKWSDLFRGPAETKEQQQKLCMYMEMVADTPACHNVASITKVLHERDNRLHFMPNEFWSNHNRQVVMNTSMWRTGKGRRRIRERPFQFVRLLLREAKVDANEEPPTAAELRNISILRSIPFVIPFIHRVQMFAELINRDKTQSGADNYVRDAYHIVVHRATLYEDAFSSLSPVKVPDMRRAIRVQMVNWVGLDEAGIDGGGIFREFLSEVIQTALDPFRGFFATTHDHLLYPNPLAPFLYPTNFEDHFYFIGRIIAKLIYEGQLADIRFADFFLAQWLGTSGDSLLDLEYVKSYDPLVHHNLKFLKTCAAEEVDALELDFSVLIDNLGATQKVELKRNGSEIKVTAENRAEYIALYVNYFLSKRLSPMIASLRAGVRAVLDPDWLRMFSSSEISILIGGIDADIDFDDLKKFTTVHNIKSEHDRLYADLFWAVINELSPSNKKKLLKFITGCSRPPLIGFKASLALSPPMGIQLVHEPDKLPTAATCMNLLKLPIYADTETLRRKLLLAINSAAGFELS